MNWWSAQNLCAVHGKQMVTIADFGAQVPAGKETCFFDYGRADEMGKSDHKCICSGGDTDCSLTNEVLSARKVFTFSWIAGSIFPSNTCLGRTVRSDGFFGGNSRNSGMDVMCR